MDMKWNRSETLALAKLECARCEGVGLRGGKEMGTKPCNCVLRSIFRACYRRFRWAVSKTNNTCARLELVQGRDRSFTWSRKDEEYAADFCLISRRELDDEDYKIFKFHFLLGADWKLCCRQLGIDRGTFFHTIYRIEHCLGRAFRETKPFGIYPLDEYFSSTFRRIGPGATSTVRGNRTSYNRKVA